MRVVLGTLMMVLSNILISQVTGQEKKNWVEIFDGKSLDGWRGYNRSDVPGAWGIEDGTLKINRKNSTTKVHQDRGDLVYPVAYEDFELKLDYKVAKGANSGVFYLVVERANKPIYQAAPEFQVLDNENHPDAKRGRQGNRQAGSLYDLIPASPQVSKPYGQWNSVRIRVKKGKVEHYLNGKKVVDYRLWDSNWDALVKESKFKEWKGFLKPGGDSKAGFIALQDHSDDVWFQNIKIKRL